MLTRLRPNRMPQGSGLKLRLIVGSSQGHTLVYDFCIKMERCSMKNGFTLQLSGPTNMHSRVNVPPNLICLSKNVDFDWCLQLLILTNKRQADYHTVPKVIIELRSLSLFVTI